MYPLNIFVSAIYMQFGTLLLDKMHPKAQMLLGGTLFCGSIMAMSYTSSYWLFLVLQSVINASGLGLIYMLPVRNAWLFYPRKKGMVSGMILMCYSVGAIIWSFLTTKLCNPDNILPTLRISNGETIEILFAPNSPVLDRVPFMIRTLAIIYFCCIMLATFLISPKEEEPSLFREPLMYNSHD